MGLAKPSSSGLGRGAPALVRSLAIFFTLSMCAITCAAAAAYDASVTKPSTRPTDSTIDNPNPGAAIEPAVQPPPVVHSPATAPSGMALPPAARAISGAFAKLADPDPLVRRAASRQLMELKPADLPLLKEAVRGARGAIVPEQAEALRDIVTHIYMAEQRPDPLIDEAGRKSGFLGVSMAPEPIVIGAGPAGEPVLQKGVLIMTRMPGFCGYPALQDGDIVVGVEELPSVSIEVVSDMSLAISTCRPGKTVHVQIIRAAKAMTIPITLDARPAGAGPAIDFSSTRENLLIDANRLFDTEFAPLLAPTIS